MTPVPAWLQLCQAAFFELDPVKLLERIAEARSAVLDGSKTAFPNQSMANKYALRHALEMLSALLTIAEREIGEQRKAGT